MPYSNQLLFNNTNELRDSGLVQVGGLQESFSNPLSQDLRNAYNIQLDFAKRLIEAAVAGDKHALRATEDMLDGTITFADVIKQFDGSQGYVGRAHRTLKESFLHTTATFANAVASCVNLTLIEAWDACTSCWEEYVYVGTDRDGCVTEGTLEINAQKKGVNNNKQIIEGGTTHTRWKFGENVNGKYCVGLFGDSVEWTWKLENCSKFDLLTAFLNRLTQAHNEGKILYVLALYAGVNGFNSDVINDTNDNIVTNNPPPTEDALNEAIDKIQNSVDSEGRPICDNRGFTVVTFNRQLGNQVQKIINTTETRISDGDTVRIVQGNGIYGDVRVCNESYGRMLATATGLGGEAYWKTAWFVITNPQRGKRNAIELSHYRGFRRPQLFKKMANTSTIGGRSLPNHGDFDTMNREVKLMSGYGGRVQYPQLLAGSLGDNSPTP